MKVYIYVANIITSWLIIEMSLVAKFFLRSPVRTDAAPDFMPNDNVIIIDIWDKLLRKFCKCGNCSDFYSVAVYLGGYYTTFRSDSDRMSVLDQNSF